MMEAACDVVMWEPKLDAKQQPLQLQLQQQQQAKGAGVAAVASDPCAAPSTSTAAQLPANKATAALRRACRTFKIPVKTKDEAMHAILQVGVRGCMAMAQI